MTEISMEKGLPTAYDDLTDEAFQPARDLIAFFIIAMKNYALYPEDNEVSQQSVENVVTRLNEFIKKYGDFRFDVKKNRLLFLDQIVHQGVPNVGDMAFILFRDGIQWFEFQKGIELPEVAGFFRLLNQFRETVEESDGDLVTALWEAQFPHLRYEATDVFLDDETLQDFSLLRVTDEDDRGRDQEVDQETSQAISDPDTYTATWELTPEEINKLGQMVLEDENLDNIEENLDVIIVILREHVEEDDLEDVLKFVLAEFRDALSRVEFQVGLNLLEKMHEIHKSCKTNRAWAIPMLDHFFKEASEYQVLNVLQEVWPVLEILGSHRLLLRQVLLLLSPEAVLAIGPMSLEVSSSRIQRELMEVIGYLAGRDIAPFERLLNHSDKNLVQRMMPVLKDLEGDRPSELLIMLARNSSEQVRKTALDTLMARDRQLLQEIFPLIDDDSDHIRRLILQYIGEDRNEFIEGLVLDYLEQRKFQRHDNQHLLACYRALGRCGSARSIPFLRRSLLNGGWIPGFSKSAHRQGAAIALMALELDEAQNLLDKASRSLFPGVRSACRKAIESSSKKKGAHIL